MKILDMLKDDHDYILETIREIQATGTAGRRRMLLARLVDDLERHMAFEEEVFYPAAAAAVPFEDVDEIEADRLEHGSAWELLADLQEDVEDDSEWAAKLAQLRGDLESHTADEENNLFPLVETHMAEATLKDMAIDYEQWMAVKRAAE